jgi:hypothetical protein
VPIVSKISASTEGNNTSFDDNNGEETDDVTGQESEPAVSNSKDSEIPSAENQPPTAIAGNDLTVNPGDVVTLDGSGSSDPEDSSLSYSWIQTDGPPVSLSGSDTSSPTFTVPSLTEEALVKFDLIVSDGGSDSSPDNVDIRVLPLSSSDDEMEHEVIHSDLSNETIPSEIIPSDLLELNSSIPSEITKSSQPLNGTEITEIIPAELINETSNEIPSLAAVNRDDMRQNGTVATKSTENGSSIHPSLLTKSEFYSPKENLCNGVTIPKNILCGADQLLPKCKPNETAHAYWTGWPHEGMCEVKIPMPSIYQCPPGPGSICNVLVPESMGTKTGTGAPIADAGPDQTVIAGSKVVLDGSSSKDPDGHKIKYSWGQAQGSDAIKLIGPSLVKPAFVAPTVEDTTTFTFWLVVGDGILVSESPDDVAITVQPRKVIEDILPPGQRPELAKLTVISHIINDNGGSKKPSDFFVRITSSNVSASTSFPGSESPGKTVPLPEGTYVVIQDSIPGYSLSSNGECGGGIDYGQTKMCIITADDRPQSPGSGSGGSSRPIGGGSSGGGSSSKVAPTPLPKPPVKQPISGATSTATVTKATSGTDSPINSSLAVNMETKRFDKLQFTKNGVMSIAKVSPFQIVRGIVLNNLTNASAADNIKLIGAQIEPKQGLAHASIVPFLEITDPKTGNQLYRAELESVINGTNPFTGRPDTVSQITDLLLLKGGNNNATMNGNNIFNSNSSAINQKNAILAKILFG